MYLSMSSCLRARPGFCAQLHNAASSGKRVDYLYSWCLQGLHYVSTVHFLLSTNFPTVWSENYSCASSNSHVDNAVDMHPESISHLGI